MSSADAALNPVEVASIRTSTRIQRPAWLPSHIPAFDGLRGIAILEVVLYHCHPRLAGTPMEHLAIWGWTGVNLFFVLSGFLITGIVLDSGDSPQFYENFYARRILRIWPVYWLLLFLNYFFFPLIFSGPKWMVHDVSGAPWAYLLLFGQNLWPIALPGTLGPTWSLAIEQQFYLFWTPLVRRLRGPLLIGAVLAMLAVSPLVRLISLGKLTPTHTLTHLDGLAVGSLIAITLRILPLAARTWRWIAKTGLGIGACGVALMLHHGSAFTDSLLAIGFGGLVLQAITPAANNARSLLAKTLEWRPLSYVGEISYGLYVTHILVFSVMGNWVDKRLDPYGTAGNLAIVAVRLVVSIGFAALLWKHFEQPILNLKRYFNFTRKAQTAGAA